MAAPKPKGLAVSRGDGGRVGVVDYGAARTDEGPCDGGGGGALPTLDAILHPPRLDALLRCDARLVTYDPYSFAGVLYPRGRNFAMIRGPLLALLLWDVAWAVVSERSPIDVAATTASLDGLVTPLLTPVSFLLVFRLGRAAVRFWDSRAAFGKLVEVCRTCASTSIVACRRGGRPDLADGFARWVCAYPIASKNFLRPDLPCAKDGRSRRAEIGPLLTDDDARELLNPATGGGSAAEFVAPLHVADRLRELAHALSFEGRDGRPDACGGAAIYRQLNEQIDALTGAWGAMERIAATPLPFAYVAHLRTFLLLYLFLWNLKFVGANGWGAVPALLAGSWALLGIEAAAVECERPFQVRANHLPLGKMCVVVAKNVAQTVKSVGCLEP